MFNFKKDNNLMWYFVFPRLTVAVVLKAVNNKWLKIGGLDQLDITGMILCGLIDETRPY